MEYVTKGKLQDFLRKSRAEQDYGNLHGMQYNANVVQYMHYLAKKIPRPCLMLVFVDSFAFFVHGVCWLLFGIWCLVFIARWPLFVVC